MIDSQLQKRLEVLKNLIVLGELDLVRVQVEKIKKASSDNSLLPIIKCLDRYEFVQATRLIDEFINYPFRLNNAPFAELPALRLQVKALEIKLAEKQSVKVDLERMIHHFYTNYQTELGEYILEVLDLRRKVKPVQVNTPQDWSEKADQEFEQYKTILDSVDPQEIPILTPERHKDLRLAFLRASKLCHPDVVAEEFKEQAQQTFIDLKQAYEENDLERILDILAMLEKGGMTVKSDQITDMDKLKAIIVTLQTRIEALNKEIIKLKESDTYRTMNGIQDWDHYFKTIRQSLMKEIHILRTRAHA